MKTIGLIGGITWESTKEYYRILNEEVNKRVGGLHSAKIIMYSFDFAEIEELQRRGKWDEIAKLVVKSAKALESGGAEFLVLCTNTTHIVAKQVENAVKIPLLHIVDPTAEALKKAGVKKVALLGTQYTMEENFYKGRLADKFGFEVLIPEADERKIVHRIVSRELPVGNIRAESRKECTGIINNLAARGAEGVILGCTELPLLIKKNDSKLPLFDTTLLHAEAAVDLALR